MLREKIYIDAHLKFSAINYCGGIFFKSLSYLYKVGCTNFSADFWTFHNTIFDRYFVKIVAPPSDENKNCLVDLKWQSLLKKGENRIKFHP